eukprot:gene7566-biopygen7127
MALEAEEKVIAWRAGNAGMLRCNTIPAGGRRPRDGPPPPDRRRVGPPHGSRRRRARRPAAAPRASASTRGCGGRRGRGRRRNACPIPFAVGLLAPPRVNGIGHAPQQGQQGRRRRPAARPAARGRSATSASYGERARDRRRPRRVHQLAPPPQSPPAGAAPAESTGWRCPRRVHRLALPPAESTRIGLPAPPRWHSSYGGRGHPGPLPVAEWRSAMGSGLRRHVEVPAGLSGQRGPPAQCSRGRAASDPVAPHCAPKRPPFARLDANGAPLPPGGDPLRGGSADAAGAADRRSELDFLNTSKRSVEVDRRSAGRAGALRALIDRADVLIESSAPGPLDPLPLPARRAHVERDALPVPRELVEPAVAVVRRAARAHHVVLRVQPRRDGGLHQGWQVRESATLGPHVDPRPPAVPRRLDEDHLRQPPAPPNRRQMPAKSPPKDLEGGIELAAKSPPNRRQIATNGFLDRNCAE